MRIARVGVAFLLVLAVASAQDSVSSSISKPENLCIVEGVVVNAATGVGVKKIEVTAYPTDGNGQPEESSTDAGGRFVINGLAPGRYTLGASGAGFPQQTYGSMLRRPGPNVLTLAPGSHERNVIFRLQPPGVITGTVRDEDGDPVVYAQVQVARIGFASHRRQVLSTNGTQTNDLGQYRVFGLEPGEYLVYATPMNAAPNGPTTDEVYLPTFHPSTPDSTQGVTVRVQPGDEISGIDIDLLKVHAVAVRGQVVLAGPARSLRGAYLQLTPHSLDPQALAPQMYGGPVQDDRGKFEIRGVPPGSYTLMMNWSDGKQALYARVPVEVGTADVEGVAVIPGPLLEMAGRLRIDPGGSLNPAQLTVSLQAVDNSGWGAAAQVKPDGTFVVEGLMDGAYRVRVGGFPEEYYVKWARAGGVDVLASGLTVSRGAPPGPLEIWLSLDGGQVEGVVLKDQKPVAGALVALVPDPPSRNRDDLYSSKSTDALGRFSLLGLPPGNFKLFAFEPREGLPVNDPEFIQDYENRGTPVRVEERKQQNVQLELIPAEEEKDR